MVGLARTGGHIGHGSGEIALAFSTTNVIPHAPESPLVTVHDIADGWMDVLFRAAIECVEESVISSLWHAETVTGHQGHTATGLQTLLNG